MHRLHKIGVMVDTLVIGLMTTMTSAQAKWKDGEYGFSTSTRMRQVRLAIVLAVITAASLISLVGASSASAALFKTARPLPTCDEFWRHSGHTDRVRWHHCSNSRSRLARPIRAISERVSRIH